MMDSKEVTGSGGGAQATNTRGTRVKSFPRKKVQPPHTHDHTASERKIHTVLGKEEKNARKKSKTYVSSDSDADEFTTECKKARFDTNLANKSVRSSETGRKYSIKHYAKDGGMMVSEDEKSRKNKVPVQDTDIIYDLSGVNSEMMSCTESPSASAMRPSSTEITLEAQKDETNEEIVKRIEQVLVSVGLVPNGIVKWQTVAEQMTDKEIEGLTAKELEDFFLKKICQIYGCSEDIAIIRFRQKKLEQAMNTWKGENLDDENQRRRLKTLMDDYNLALEAVAAKRSKQLMSSTAGMSSGQISKEGHNNKTPTKIVHKKKNTMENLNETKRNTLQVRETQSGIIPTQGAIYLLNKSLPAGTKESANSVLGEGDEDTSVLLKPVSSTKTLVSQKEQNQSAENKINTTPETGQVRTKKCFVHQATMSKPCTHTTAKGIEVIDLTLDDDLPFAESAIRTSSVAENTTATNKAVETILAPNTSVGKHDRQTQASSSSSQPALVNSVNINIESGESSAGTSSYVAHDSKTVKKERKVGVATIFILPEKGKKTNAVPVPQPVGPAPLLAPGMHDNVFNRLEERNEQNILQGGFLTSVPQSVVPAPLLAPGTHNNIFNRLEEGNEQNILQGGFYTSFPQSVGPAPLFNPDAHNRGFDRIAERNEQNFLQGGFLTYGNQQQNQYAYENYVSDTDTDEFY